MRLNNRLEKLEKGYQGGGHFLYMDMELDETVDQAIKRGADERGVPVEAIMSAFLLQWHGEGAERRLRWFEYPENRPPVPEEKQLLLEGYQEFQSLIRGCAEAVGGY
ncbi:MAG: hypothetical protein HN344_09125 [Gammaproteobacteria bacterium]|jgi:hypothetical protein|nr:hypothetical protein [Gammaproteobacteria bacterium]